MIRKPHEFVRVSFEWVKGRKFFACWFLMQQKKAVEGSKNMFLQNYFGNTTDGKSFKKEPPFVL